MGQKIERSLNHEREKVQDQRDSEQAQKTKARIWVQQKIEQQKKEREEETEEMERFNSSKEEKTDDPGWDNEFWFSKKGWMC